MKRYCAVNDGIAHGYYCLPDISWRDGMGYKNWRRLMDDLIDILISILLVVAIVALIVSLIVLFVLLFLALKGVAL